MFVYLGFHVFIVGAGAPITGSSAQVLLLMVAFVDGQVPVPLSSQKVVPSSSSRADNSYTFMYTHMLPMMMTTMTT